MHGKHIRAKPGLVGSMPREVIQPGVVILGAPMPLRLSLPGHKQTSDSAASGVGAGQGAQYSERSSDADARTRIYDAIRHPVCTARSIPAPDGIDS